MSGIDNQQLEEAKPKEDENAAIKQEDEPISLGGATKKRKKLQSFYGKQSLITFTDPPVPLSQEKTDAEVLKQH